jgi:Uma2 family endonuclease
MTQARPQSTSLEDFLDWYPDGYGRYELIDGVIVELQPTGKHIEVTSFVISELNFEIRRLNLPYLMAMDCVVKPIDSDKSGYKPDAIVLDRVVLSQEPLWENRSTITKGETVRLIVEVVSTNWRDDYLKKLADYEALGIPEYWIVDYGAFGAARYLGKPKQPTVSVYTLLDDEYQVSQFREGDRIASLAFPELTLTAAQLFSANG